MGSEAVVAYLQGLFSVLTWKEWRKTQKS